MTGSFKDGESGALAGFYLDNTYSRDIPATIVKQLRRKLSLIEAAATEKSLLAPTANHYRKLTDNLSSIRVSVQWRLVFRWLDGHAYDLHLDSHQYQGGLWTPDQQNQQP